MIQLLKYNVVLFEKFERRGVPVLISSLIILGVIPLLLLIVLFSDELSLFNSLAVYLVFAWFMFSRYLVYLGLRTAQESFNNFKELFLDLEKFKRKNYQLCHNFYSNKAILISLPFVLCGVYIVNNYFYNASFGLHIWLTIVIISLLLFAGIGLWNSFGALFYVANILKDDLRIDPMHPDGFGGLEPIGDFIIKATLIISTGSLIIPFALIAASEGVIGGEFRFITLILTGLYIFIVLLSFIVPLLKLNNVAKRYKYSIIKEAVGKYDVLLKELLDNPTSENQAKIELYHGTYLVEIKKMKIWPFTGLTLIQVFGAIALPAATLILQILGVL
jgi:hypothetical protein